MTENKKDHFHWRTAIAYKTKDQIVVRCYDINDLTGNIDFTSMAYLVWTGNLPPENYKKMLNAMLVSLSEHAFSPSAASCRFVRSGGVPLNTAVAGGILTLGTQHASADIPAAMFQEGIIRAEIEGMSIEEGEREKGWRASTQTGITQPLDLSLQLPEYYDGPEDRSLGT